MLIDSVTIRVRAGNGGRGAVAFSNIKMTLGPTGGSGGRGGDAYLEAVADLGALRRFKASKSFSAEDGSNGRSSLRDGSNGADLVLRVPRGTKACNAETGACHELLEIGERIKIAVGGRGGKGNFQHKSSTNTSPRQSQPGLPGETATLTLDLSFIADVGLIGLPNVGKSSLLNEFTSAKSKVANYPFTTLEPHLGSYYGLIIADIPGLIEGASQGKGLGTKFLRHIERTSTLIHCIDANSTDPLSDYKTIRAELGAYNTKLLDKPEFIFITRSDTVDEARLNKLVTALAPLKRTTIPVSIYDPTQIATARKLLDSIAT